MLLILLHISQNIEMCVFTILILKWKSNKNAIFENLGDFH